MTPEEAARVFTDPVAYADAGGFHRAATLLRREAPVHRVEADGFPPFYALTRHAEVLEVERQPAMFHNAPRPVLIELERERVLKQAGELATLIHMDDPEHRAYRALTADWFQPRSLARLEARLAELAQAAVDRMADAGGACDFAQDIAAPMPLQVILAILGLPESDYDKMLVLTRELFGGEDPEYARGSSFEEFMAVIFDFFVYFGALTDERRARPTGDLASVIANATVDGEPILPFQLISLLPRRRHRRARHDGILHVGRARRPPRPSRPAGPPPGRPRSDAERGGRDDPLVLARAPLLPNRHRALRARRVPARPR